MSLNDGIYSGIVADLSAAEQAKAKVLEVAELLVDALFDQNQLETGVRSVSEDALFDGPLFESPRFLPEFAYQIGSSLFYGTPGGYVLNKQTSGRGLGSFDDVDGSLNVTLNYKELTGLLDSVFIAGVIASRDELVTDVNYVFDGNLSESIHDGGAEV